MSEQITPNPSVPTQVVAEVTFPKFINNLGIIPTSYKDSMSYYECLAWLCKYLEETVIPSVNQNGNAVQELQNLYIELNSYVTHYFDNLDVSTEINNKLDNMVQSGELQTLLSGQYQELRNEVNSTIDSFENQVNNSIESFENQVNNSLDQFDIRLTNVASGTPLSASSTSGMTDTSRIYVNTSDGYWYYYNGASWVQGGVYQSTSLSNGSVHHQNLDNPLKYNLTSKSSNINLSTINVGYVNPNGSITTEDIGQLGYYEFTVTPFDTYKLHIYIYGFTDSLVCIQLLNNTTVITNILKSSLTVENNYYDYTLSIPTNVNKVRINTQRLGHTSSQIDVGNYITKVENYNMKNIAKENLDSKLKTFFSDVYEEITPTTFISECLLATTLTSYAYSDILSYDVIPGEKFKITAKQIYGNAIVFFTTPNKITTISYNGNSYNIQNFIDVVKSETSNYQFEDYEFTVPAGCNKLYFNKSTTDSTYKLEKVTSYKVKASDIAIDLNKVGFNKLIAIGDSLTEKNLRALYNYLDYIKTDIPTLTIQNLGVSGTGYYNDGSPNSSFVDRINSISSYDLDTDIILVMGSINDVGNVPSHLGELGDTTTSTIYGSMYNFFTTLFNTYNGVRIGVVSPLNWKESENNSSLPLYLKALEDTCKLFNIPYLDIHDKTNLRPNDSTFLNTYYEADGTGSSGQVDENGVHPNSLGHKLIYGRIKDFICRL